MSLRRRLRLMPEILVASCCWLVIPLLPRRLVVACARAVGALAWRLARRERRISEANLTLALGATYPPDELHAIGRASFQHVALTFLDIFWFSRWFDARYRRCVQSSPEFCQALAHAPLVGVTGHLGNWEILRTTCGMEGVPMTAVAMPLKNPVIDRMLARLRQRTGARTVPRAGAVRSLLRCLRERGITGLLLDQNTLPDEGGVFVPFFGVPVAVSNVAGLLAVKTGTQLLVAAALPDRKGIYRIVVRKLISPHGKTAAEVTAAITLQLEALIREHPAYWLWAYKRWHFYRPGDPREAYPYYAKDVRQAKRKH